MSALRTWAHKYDPRVQRAKATLATMPIASSGHGAAVPWPYVDRNEVKKYFSNRDINKAIIKAPIESIDIRHDPELFAIQHSVKAPQVAFYLDHPESKPEGHMNDRSKTPDDVPVVIAYDGKRYIWDGHHRLTAEWLRGASDADVRLVVLSK